MTEDITTQDQAVSTGLSSGEDNSFAPDDSYEDAFNIAMNGIFDDVEAPAPSKVEEKAEELEDSGDETEEQTETPEDDSDIEDKEPDEDEDTGEELNVVNYEEMQNYLFELGGKNYSAGDLKSALGQLSKQEEARNEVEAQRTELETAKAVFEEQRSSHQRVLAGDQRVAQLQNAYANLQQMQSKALEDGNGNELSIINTKLSQLEQEYNNVARQMDQDMSTQAAAAAQALDNFGFGSINTDTQRQEAFIEYGRNNIPQSLISLVNVSPEMLVLVEKARLYDKSNSTSNKGKLKATKKTLKAGVSKAKPKKAKSNEEAAIDAVLKDFFD